MKRDQLGTHSILALEEFQSHRYVQPRVESHHVAGIERIAGDEFCGHASQQRAETDEFADGNGAGNLRGKIPMFQEQGNPGRIVQMIRELAETIPLESIGQIKPRELATKTHGDVFIIRLIHCN